VHASSATPPSPAAAAAVDTAAAAAAADMAVAAAAAVDMTAAAAAAVDMTAAVAAAVVTAAAVTAAAAAADMTAAVAAAVVTAAAAAATGTSSFVRMEPAFRDGADRVQSALAQLDAGECQPTGLPNVAEAGGGRAGARCVRHGEACGGACGGPAAGHATGVIKRGLVCGNVFGSRRICARSILPVSAEHLIQTRLHIALCMTDSTAVSRLANCLAHLQPQYANSAVPSKFGKVEYHTLLTFITTLVKVKGSSSEEADTVAWHLCESNLKGHDSHGIGMIPQYFNSIDRKLLHVNSVPDTLMDSGACVAFDAKRGYGQAAAKYAVLAAVERAQQHGICCYTLRNSSHIGRVGTYAEFATNKGMIYFSWANVVDHAPLVAPHGGKRAIFGTNPVSMGVPASSKYGATILDMATSKVALGKTRVAFNKGVDLPDGCLIDENGTPTNDASVMWGSKGTAGQAATPTGALRPFGEYKGSGVAMIAELLAGAISGGGTIAPHNERKDSIVNHQFAIVVDPSKLIDIPYMKGEIDKLMDFYFETPSAAGQEVMAAGDPERKSKAERMSTGIPVDEKTWTQLTSLAEKLGVSVPSVSFA
jgi:uncharacterized oxidoreductase